MPEALWIDENYLMQNSTISEDTDMKQITPNILYCQKVYIKKLLGSDLYDNINSAIVAQMYTPVQTALLNSDLKDCLMNYVISESIPDIKFRITNKGLQEKNSENSNTTAFSEMKFMTDRYKNRAEVFASRVTAFLEENYSTYATWLNGNTGLDDIQPKKNKSYQTGIYLGDDDDDDCKDRFYR